MLDTETLLKALADINVPAHYVATSDPLVEDDEIRIDTPTQKGNKVSIQICDYAGGFSVDCWLENEGLMLSAEPSRNIETVLSTIKEYLSEH